MYRYAHTYTSPCYLYNSNFINPLNAYTFTLKYSISKKYAGAAGNKHKPGL